MTTPDDAGTDLPEDRTRMSFLEHLEELRKRIIYSLWALLAGCGISLLFVERLYNVILAYLAWTIGGHKLIATEITEAFMFEFKIGLFAGLLIASPFIFAQIWLFVAPGLYQKEKRIVLPFAIFTSALFVTGVGFNHYLAFPAMMRYFSKFNGEYLEYMPQISVAWSFYFKMAVGLGVIFEMPIAVFFLARFGVVTWRFLARQWRWAILIAFIVAAVITPSPDAVTQTVFAAPMILLYVVSIGVAWVFGKRGKTATI